jgi:hypothetical protein
MDLWGAREPWASRLLEGSIHGAHELAVATERADAPFVLPAI